MLCPGNGRARGGSERYVWLARETMSLCRYLTFWPGSERCLVFESSRGWSVGVEAGVGVGVGKNYLMSPADKRYHRGRKLPMLILSHPYNKFLKCNSISHFYISHLKSCQRTVGSNNSYASRTDLRNRLTARQLHTSLELLVKDFEH